MWKQRNATYGDTDTHPMTYRCYLKSDESLDAIGRTANEAIWLWFMTDSRSTGGAEMIRIPVDSTCVASAGYDPTTATMEVEFVDSGRVYAYHGVPPQEFAAFMLSDSKGEYFTSNIKPVYRAEMKG